MTTATFSPTAPVTATSRAAARLAFAGALLFLVLLAALHVIRPDVDPSWRMVSEYAVGRHGWVMTLAFVSLAVGYASLFVVLVSQVRTIAGRIGLAFLLAAMVGVTMAAIFPTDPMNTGPEEMTAAGEMHGLAATIGIPSLPVAAMLISFSLRHNPAWARGGRALLWMANLTWISLALMLATVAILLPRHGAFGPEVPVGWPNRLLMIAYGGWVMLAAGPATRASP